LLPNDEHSAARRYLVSSAVWLCIATLGGLFSAIQLFSPDVLRNIPFLEFGRVRPAHTNMVLFGFVGLMSIGAGLYIVPVMLRTRLYGQRLANLSLLLYNLALLGAVATLPLGFTQGREYAELVFPVKVLFLGALLLLLYVLIMTVLRRRESLLYVSVWYICGGVLWTTLLFPLGNVMWHPATGALTGTVDAVWLWFYGHNIFGLFLTPLALAIAYYVIPRVAQAPLYSHTLSLIGFWTLLAFYTHIGTHHLIQAPVPTWLKTISVVDSIGMVVPVMTVLVNLWLTTKDNLGNFTRSVPGKFVFVGVFWYLITCLQGPLQSLPSVQRYTHFNNWVIGHAHIAVLGFSGMIALGGLWYVLPLVSGRRVFSMNLANLQFWLVLVGISGFFGVLTIAGLIQGGAWANGETVYRALPLIAPYMGLRLAFGLLIVTGAFIGLYNVLMTLARGERMQP
jgi:cytochrome c oxidase cbb3-type subunit 1/cytochrome c oxidase cbb3-type subunit I/II